MITVLKIELRYLGGGTKLLATYERDGDHRQACCTDTKVWIPFDGRIMHYVPKEEQEALDLAAAKFWEARKK